LPIALGMSLGFLGDLLMARWLPAGERLLEGMGAFGLGHLAYIVGLLLFMDRHSLAGPLARWGAWLAWLLVALLGWYLVIWRPATRAGGRPGVLHWAALPYSLLLGSTAGLATALAIQAPAFLPMAIGTALFLVSDTLLGANQFNHAYCYLIDDLIWLTYGPAQMMIVYSISNALRVTA
jgi:hypothetical protein